MAPAEPGKANEVYIKYVPRSATKDSLWEYFAELGEIFRVYCPVDRATKENKGFAYIIFKDKSAADSCVDEWNGCELDGKHLHITHALADPREKPAKPAGVCFDWQQGKCKFGDKCRFAHGDGVSKSSKVCFDFQKGNCKFGANCRFQHPASQQLPDGEGMSTAICLPAKGPAKASEEEPAVQDTVKHKKSKKRATEDAAVAEEAEDGAKQKDADAEKGKKKDKKKRKADASEDDEGAKKPKKSKDSKVSKTADEDAEGDMSGEDAADRKGSEQKKSKLSKKAEEKAAEKLARKKKKRAKLLAEKKKAGAVDSD